jgi:hypothetical protein
MKATPSMPFSISQAFFPYKTRNSFTPETSPAFRFNDGQDSEFFITDIKRGEGGNITFKVRTAKDVIPNVTDVKYETYDNMLVRRYGEKLVKAIESGGEKTEWR